MGVFQNKTNIFLLLCLCFGIARSQGTLPPADLINSFDADKLNSGWVKYEINASIEDSVKEHASKDEQANYQVMTLKESKAAKKKSKSEFLSYINFNKKDTANIILLPKAPLNLGFRLLIINDSCKVFFFAFESDPPSGIFKMNKNDAEYISKILVPAKLCRVILMKKPEFKPDEIINGYLEFESLPYRIRYDKYYDEAERSYVEGYFSTSDFVNAKPD
jgi:hypothetical protein